MRDHKEQGHVCSWLKRPGVGGNHQLLPSLRDLLVSPPAQLPEALGASVGSGLFPASAVSLLCRPGYSSAAPKAKELSGKCNESRPAARHGWFMSPRT